MLVSRRVGVIFPEAGLTEVERFRMRWDPLGGKVAAHVTVLFPLPWQGSVEQLAETLAAVTARYEVFRLRLGGVSVWEGDYLFLLILDGESQVRRLHEDVYAALGEPAPAVFLPHMTIARQPHPGQLALAVRAAETAGIQLDAVAAALSVYRVEPDGRRIREFDLPLS